MNGTKKNRRHDDYDNSSRPYWIGITILLFILFVVLTSKPEATGVKHCKNYETGEIIVIEDGYPCPFPTSEI